MLLKPGNNGPPNCVVFAIVQYRRSGFNCEILLIAKCEFFHNLQSKESQVQEYTMFMCDHAPSAQAHAQMHFSHVFLTFVRRSSRLAIEIEKSLHRYFKSTVNLPTPSQAQLLPNVLREVNRTVTAVLEREEVGNLAKLVKKRKYNR